MNKDKYYVASCSGGKDSVAMTISLIERKYPLNEGITFDWGMEFKAVYNSLAKIKALCEENGIKYTVLKHKHDFMYLATQHEVRNEKTHEVHKVGYSWCGGTARWGTTFKERIIRNYYNSLGDYDVVDYVGIAFDEKERVKDKCYPLIEWEMAEKDCLDFCYSRGIYFEETDEITGKTFRLYDYLPRVSCWCCRNKNLEELRNYYHFMPSYWNKLKQIQAKLYNDPMKKQSGSVFDLEKRFVLEDKWIKDGKGDKLKTKEFFKELKEIL